MFWLWRLLGKAGFFEYHGSASCAPAWWPKAKVIYSEGRESRAMPVGNAVSYAEIFKGRIVPA